MKEENTQQGKAYERVITYIKSEILKGDLKRGEKLPPERELAERLGVGRNSVREALRTLSLMGFISSTQGAGNFVSCDIEKNLAESVQMMMLLGATDYRQVSELRQGLESQAVLLASERINPAQLSELEDIVWQLRDEDDLERSTILDKRLHYLIGEAAGNPFIMVILRAMSETIDDFISHMRGQMMKDEVYRKQLQDSHQGIALALQDHNGAEAVRMMREHFQVVDNAMVDLF
ncbi:FadR/GntR family transcriptional regulator [Intestinimonas sp.]|uniref:FadR/GntR family transcriptional regulator n=1 Tax=Intestinimonas sp. TaxID=1965293 RepID=UPI002614E507|nr:FadR/GntR family transcriptional regulator [Intestinimonas sp.]